MPSTFDCLVLVKKKIHKATKAFITYFIDLVVNILASLYFKCSSLVVQSIPGFLTNF